MLAIVLDNKWSPRFGPHSVMFLVLVACWFCSGFGSGVDSGYGCDSGSGYAMVLFWLGFWRCSVVSVVSVSVCLFVLLVYVLFC